MFDVVRLLHFQPHQTQGMQIKPGLPGARSKFAEQLKVLLERSDLERDLPGSPAIAVLEMAPFAARFAQDPEARAVVLPES